MECAYSRCAFTRKPNILSKYVCSFCMWWYLWWWCWWMTLIWNGLFVCLCVWIHAFFREVLKIRIQYGNWRGLKKHVHTEKWLDFLVLANIFRAKISNSTGGQAASRCQHRKIRLGWIAFGINAFNINPILGACSLSCSQMA